MTQTTRTITASIAARRLYRTLLWGMTAAAVASSVSDRFVDEELFLKSKGRNLVASALRNDEFATAAHLLENTELYPGTREHLETILDSDRAHDLFEFALEVGDVDRAHGVIHYWRIQGTYPDGQLYDLEKRIFSITEQGMREQIINATSNGVIELSKTYFERFPNTRHRDEMLSEYVRTVFENPVLFPDQYERITDLNHILSQYQEEGITLSDEAIRSVEEANLLDIYFRDEYVSLRGFRVEVGTYVQIIESSQYSNPTYTQERDASFPIGSIGRVTEKDSVGLIYVQFDPEIETHWEYDWGSLQDHWGQKKNVAGYVASELAIVYPEINRDMFEHAIQTTRQLIGSERQGQ